MLSGGYRGSECPQSMNTSNEHCLGKGQALRVLEDSTVTKGNGDLSPRRDHHLI